MAGYDLHIHSLFSDGELLPAEIARRYSELGYEAIAITDHVDNSNIDFILSNLVPACEELTKNIDLNVIPGVELTHVPPGMMAKLVKKAKNMKSRVIVVHGETIVEPVAKGTNTVALRLKDVDILAHPGLITEEEASLAAKNGIYLELSARTGHCLTNGHVARLAQEAGAKLLVNTDAHSPSDIIEPDMAERIATGAGLNSELSKIITTVNPISLVGDL
ncbi:MAG: histidinol phosphate phosphatase domain-containing protein [Candidatus Hydrothermarchaeaceae archaeon]